MNSLIGKVFNEEYEITEELGHGGMGVVYLVERKSWKQTLALKIINAEYSGNEKLLKRFQREIKILAKLVHKNVVRLWDYGFEHNVHYYVMEYVKGESLKDVLDSDSKMYKNIKKVTDIIIQICRGLKEAHKMGIIHRDIKPDNIMLVSNKTVKILDFGVAGLMEGKVDGTKYTSTGMGGIGTGGYMSPEQSRGEKNIDGRSDIYSLGIVFYEILTGDIPHGVFQPASSCNKAVSSHIDAIIDKMLQSDNEKRYKNVSEIINDLRKSKLKVPESTITTKGNAKKSKIFFIILSFFLIFSIIIFGFMKINSAIKKMKEEKEKTRLESEKRIAKIKQEKKLMEIYIILKDKVTECYYNNKWYEAAKTCKKILDLDIKEDDEISKKYKKAVENLRSGYLIENVYTIPDVKNVDLSCNLRWKIKTPDYNGKIAFELYFGKDNSSLEKISDVSGEQYEIKNLSYATTYYWRVDVKDEFPGIVEGDVQSFTTVSDNAPPYKPFSPIPEIGKKVSVDTTLSWKGGDPDSGDTVSYNIYFGTNPTPPFN